jgi:hypothetical protein
MIVTLATSQNWMLLLLLLLFAKKRNKKIKKIENEVFWSLERFLIVRSDDFPFKN